jgi:hypothetical protein
MGETTVSFILSTKQWLITSIAETRLAYLLQFDKQGSVDSTTTRAYQNYLNMLPHRLT